MIGAFLPFFYTKIKKDLLNWISLKSLYICFKTVPGIIYRKMNYAYMYQLIHTVNNPRLISVRYYPFMTKGDHRSVISRGVLTMMIPIFSYLLLYNEIFENSSLKFSFFVIIAIVENNICGVGFVVFNATFNNSSVCESVYKVIDI